MDYLQVDIYTTTAGIEPVGAALLELGTGGCVVQDAADFEQFLAGKNGRWDYIDDALMKLREAETTLSVYLAENEQGARQLEELREELVRLRGLDVDREWGRLELALKTVREQDWAETWKQYYKPQKIGERLVVCPSWEEYKPGAGETVLRLDPGMAFGTGTHESTRLCLTLVQKYLRPGARVLDVGCGSGILAIAALLLGAGEAAGVDIDEVAVTTARDNAARNGVREQAEFHCGSLADHARGRYDVVFTNIVADVIIGFAPEIPGLLAPGGVWIGSGIIDTREGDVLAALAANGLAVAERTADGGWVGLCARAADGRGV